MSGKCKQYLNQTRSNKELTTKVLLNTVLEMSQS